MMPASDFVQNALLLVVLLGLIIAICEVIVRFADQRYTKPPKRYKDRTL